MYEAFYGMRERPFDLVPNPRFLFLAGRHREALSNLQYGLTTPRGITLLLGDAGTGKTTLVQAALAQIPDGTVKVVLVSNPTLTRAEFYEHLADQFGLGEAAAASKTRFLFEFRRELLERHTRGVLTALVLDEAQSLPYELLEEIRLLSNMETTTTKLLNVVLAGQPELADRLNESSLRHLKQRVSLRCQLCPMDITETASYIAGRIRIAGGRPDQIFTREAVQRIFEGSHGVPRTVNVVCDNVLISGFAAQVKPIPVAFVEEVMRDFDFHPADEGSPFASEEGAGRTGPATAMTLTDLASRAAADEGPERAGIVAPVARKRRFSFF